MRRRVGAVYSEEMRSKVAEETRRADRERILAMTPAERFELALKLRERGIEIYMDANNVDRETALQRLYRIRHLGRRPSRCNDDR